jgi:hypothetical protein
LVRVSVAAKCCAVGLRCRLLDVEVQSSRALRGGPMLQTPTGSRDGDSQQAHKPSSRRELRVQAEPTRLRLQISAHTSTILALHCAQCRMAPAMAAPIVRSVAAGSRTAWDIDESSARSSAERSPVHVVCLCRERLQPGSRYALNDTACTRRQSMHKSARSSITSLTTAVSERRQAPHTPESVQTSAATAASRAGGWDETVSSIIERSQHGIMAPDQTRARQ